MKKKGIFQYVSKVTLMLSLAVCFTVSAKAKTITDAKEGKTYKIDLDQDGVKEKVKLKHVTQEDSPDNVYGEVYIDGKKKYTTDTEAYGYGINMKFVTCGDQVFINLSQETDNDILLINKLLYLKEDKLIEAVDFKSVESGIRGCEITSAKEGKIIVRCEAQPNQLASILWNSTYIVDGTKVTLKSHVHKVKSGIPDRSVSSFVTNKKLTFTTKVGNKTTAFKVGAGKKVQLISIVTKGDKIYGYFKYGKKKGYVRVDPYYEKAYFKNVYKYLAG
ncbi:hypothetical protein [Anaerosporobacter faecicola]|uniref:hypothetical protein n=1 Tax=Anaerosporobacter faecicola TaxID=2718714 RepID=UPI00143AF519|nr:hypothetical protein [Anaerosporobacter faecicola]